MYYPLVRESKQTIEIPVAAEIIDCIATIFSSPFESLDEIRLVFICDPVMTIKESRVIEIYGSGEEFEYNFNRKYISTFVIPNRRSFHVFEILK